MPHPPIHLQAWVSVRTAHHKSYHLEVARKSTTTQLFQCKIVDVEVMQQDFEYMTLSSAQSIPSRNRAKGVRFQDGTPPPTQKPNSDPSAKKREMLLQLGLKRNPLDVPKEGIEMDDETRNNTACNKENSVPVKERLLEFQTKANTRANAGFLTPRNQLLVLQAEEEMMIESEKTGACEESEPMEGVTVTKEAGRQTTKVAFKEKLEVIY